MNSGESNRPQWKFDPNTGERISTDASPQSSTPADTGGEAFRAPQQSAPQQPYTPPQQSSYQPETPTPQPPTQPYTYAPQQPAPAATAAPAAKKAGRAPLIAGVIALLLVATLAGGYMLFQNVVNRPAVSVERLLPANTLGYFSFDPVLEGQQKAAMDKLREAFESQPGFKEAWEKMTDDAASVVTTDDCDSADNLNNLDNLATYLGNSVTVAILAPDSDDLQRLEDGMNDGTIDEAATDLLTKNVVGILDLDFNPLNKKGPISDLKQQADNAGKAELVERYRDVDIRKFSSCNNEIYFALFDGSATAIVGAEAAPLKVLIDGYRDNKTLKDEATFKALSGQVPQERIAAFYINLTEVYKQVQLVAPELMEEQSLQNVSGASLMTLSAADDGMQLDIASETDLSLMGTSVQVNPDARPDQSTLNDIPTDALGFYAGTDLKTSLQAALDQVSASPELSSEVEEMLSSLEEQTNINVRQDLLPLLGGDYVLSVALNNMEGEVLPGVVFQMKMSEPQKMSDILDRAISPQQNPNSTAEVIELLGGKFYGDLNSGVLLGVAQDRLWVVFDMGGSAETRLQGAINELGKGFGTTPEWNTAKGHLVRDSNGLMYVDVTGIRELVETQFLDTPSNQEDYEAGIAPFVRPLKYLLMGSATQAARNGELSRNHTVVFIGIAK